MSLQSFNLFGHGVEVFSIILLPRGLHSPKSGTADVHVLAPCCHVQSSGCEGGLDCSNEHTKHQWNTYPMMKTIT